MPEFNQNFIKGRMNKDLDERLVPNGEYRDALNVSVSTSESANVGTVQTLKGNTLKGNTLNGFCVGSIADEKTNNIYYLVSGENKDAIIEYNSESETEKPILVDIYKLDITVAFQGIGPNFQYIIVSSQDNIRPGMVVTGTLGGVVFNSSSGLTVSRIEEDTTPGLLRVYLKWNQSPNNYPTTNIPSNFGDVLTFTAKRALNFNENSFVTGINVIDDFLFWTDNRYEPKQISISRCIEGTTSINKHTVLKVKDLTSTGGNSNLNLNFPNSAISGKDHLKEEHITVVKKSPLIPPTLEMSNTREDRVNGIYAESSFNFAGIVTTGSNTDVQNDTVVDANGNPTTYNITFTSPVSYLEGDIVMVSNSPTNQGAGSFPSHQIRLKVDAVLSSTQYVFLLEAITSDTLSQFDEDWFFLLDQEKSMFSFKFPRFSYRYKYADGEYSSFAPFSEPAFLPSQFDYFPKKGFNLGMVNDLRFLKIKDFVLEKEMLPKQVVAIDILYKESNSPNVYTVKTILRNSEEWNQETTGGLMKGATIIESELIYATLPSNQLLRPWDNVPRRALGQEVTGNRIVYGNYLQNYNLKDVSGTNINIDISATLAKTEPELKQPGKSIKSLRTYQLGVVYRDEFGRETPVLASSQPDVDVNNQLGETKGTLTVAKKDADKYSRVEAKVMNEPPVWADSYKFFIKETSNEYYNIAMDRWYNAEDGNIWISFPSKERNKVDIDTVLILKKQHDNDVFVDDTARYRVLAVENEAPQYIKKKRSTFGSVTMTFNVSGQPLEDRVQVFADQTTFANSGLVESMGKSDCVMRIQNTGNKSLWYPIGGVSLANGGGYYIVTINGKFGPDMAFTDPDGDGTVIGNLELEIAQNVYENRPEFDGRFFVKIFKDIALEENIVKVSDTVPDFAVVQSRHHFYLTNRQGRDDDWWSLAWERGDLFIDGEARGLVGKKSGIVDIFASNAYITQSQATSMGFTINSDYWNGNGGPFPLDRGYGLNTQLTGGTSSLGPIGPRPSSQVAPNTIIPSDYSLELSVSGLKDGMEFDKVGAYSLGGVKTLNQISFWQSISSVGTMFRWRNDPDGVIYVITGAVDSGQGGGGISTNANGHGILNFSSSTIPLSFANAREEDDNKTRRLYLTFKTTDEGYRKDSQLSEVDPNSGLANVDPEMYFSDTSLMSQDPWWKGGFTPPSGFDPTRDYHDYTPAPSGNYATYPAAAGYIGQSNPIDSSTRSQIGNPGSNITENILDEYTNTIEIIDIYYDEFESRQSDNPGIWETEPKEDVGLDIYYEASQAYPLELNGFTNELYAPYKSIVKNEGHPSSQPPTPLVSGTFIKNWDDNRVFISSDPTNILNQGDIISFTRPDGSITRARVTTLTGPNSANTAWGVVCSRSIDKMKMTLPWFNCYSFGNGVESNRIRDDFNQVTIDKGPKVSTTLATPYEEERRGTGLIYSGIYNSNSGINNLNQFIMAEPITKDLNPRFGTIQKLHSRDTDVITLCEDKVLKILANKDAVFNADGNVNLTATNRVLGQVIPFSGEYGISKNPESFAFQAYRSYFSDRARGVVLRLSKDGLTPISQHGMKDFFADNLRNAYNILGSYDDKKSLYNISLKCVKDSTQNSDNGGSTTITTTNNAITGLNTDGNMLGHWFRYGGIVDDWAKAIENGAFGQGLTDIGNINSNLPAGSNNAIGYTNGGHYKGWTGIQAGSLHPAGVFHGKEGKYGLNPGLVNTDITLYFDHQTQGLAWHASFDATPNFDDLIDAFNIHGPGNVYLYQTMFYSNFASHNPLLGCTGIFCTQALVNWPYNWYGAGGVPTPGAAGSLAHQPEAVYSIKDIEYEASSKTYKMVVNWLVGYSGWQDFQTFKWSLDNPFIVVDGDDGDDGNGNNGDDENNKGIKDYTVSFSDKTNGWVSFKSWIQESGLSLNNKFYTMFGGSIWEHHSNNSRNNFYNATYEQISTIDVLLNEAPNTVKSIDYLKYSGSQAAVTINTSIANFDGEYYNNFAKLGWFASSIETDMQSGRVLEFKEKENKWFSAMQGEKTYFNTALDTNIDMAEFSFQGIGNVTVVSKDDVSPPPPPPDPVRVVLTIEDDPTDH